MLIRAIKLITTLLFVFVSINTSFAASIHWQSYSQSAFAKAKSEHRKVLLYGMASWCPWCRRMKSNVFTDSTVIDLINKHYIAVMIDIDSEPDIASRYQIEGVPANIIVDGDYKVIDSKVGYINSNKMASFLRSNAN